MSRKLHCVWIISQCPLAILLLRWSLQLVPTDEMPSLGQEPFSPFVLEQNAATLLKFLQASCSTNFSSYWLYKKQGDSAIQLFDLASFPAQQQVRCVGCPSRHGHACARRRRHVAASVCVFIRPRRVVFPCRTVRSGAT